MLNAMYDWEKEGDEKPNPQTVKEISEITGSTIAEIKTMLKEYELE